MTNIHALLDEMEVAAKGAGSITGGKWHRNQHDCVLDADYLYIISSTDSAHVEHIVASCPQNVLRLCAELRLAINYLRQAKIKFTPTTTNSDVDVFLERYK